MLAWAGCMAHAEAAVARGAGRAQSRAGGVTPSPRALAARPRGQCPSQLCVCPALHWTCHPAVHSGGCGTRSSRRVWHGFVPARPISPLSVLCVGQGWALLTFTAVSRPRQGPAEDAPAAPLGPVPAAAQVWLWGSSCSPCARDIPAVLATSLAFPMSESCAMSCVPPLCASVCPVSLQHVPCPHSMSGVPVS